MVDKKDVRKQINDFCLSHVFNGSGGIIPIGKFPMAVIVYLGKGTREELGGFMDEAFKSMLCREPLIQDMTIDSPDEIDCDSFMQALMQRLKWFADQGGLVAGRATNIQLSFVALMDEPLLSDPAFPEKLPDFREAIDNIELLGKYTLGDVAFFGLFDQKKTKRKVDYTAALNAVNRGSSANANVWNRIYHMHRDLIADSYEHECRTAAMQILHDALFVSGPGKAVSDDPDNYKWFQLGLDEMKLPEQLICNMLITGYRAQSSAAPLSQKECEIFRDSLETELLNAVHEKNPIMHRDDWTIYLPRNPESRQEMVQRSGFLGFGKRTVQLGGDVTHMLCSEQQLDDILTEETQDMIRSFEESEIYEIFRKSLGVFQRIDSASTRLRDTLISELDMVLQTLSNKKSRIPLRSNETTEGEYLRDLFRQYADKEAYEFAIDVLDWAKNSQEFSVGLKGMLDDLLGDVSVIVSSLDELRVNSYGGAPSLKLPMLVPNFIIPVGTTIEDACNLIDQSVLNRLVEDSTILDNNRQAAISKAQYAAVNQTAIGSIAGEFNSDEIEYTIMVDHGFDDAQMKVQNSSLFRANTMLILSTCRWDSQKNLFIYYRGGNNG